MTMTAIEQGVAEQVYAAIQASTRATPRAQQDRDFRVGVSTLGFCSERLRRMLNQEVPQDKDMLKAFIGTALGEFIERACLEAWPHAITQADVEVVLHGDMGTYTIGGHPDLIVDNMVLDFKTVFGLEAIRRTGPSNQQRYQRMLYAAGAHAKGLFGDTPLDQILVGNVWMDRGGVDTELHCQMEPFDQSVVDEATAWLEEVIYSYTHGEPARKEPPREMCAKVCGFYETCRAYDTDVEGLLTDPTVLAAVEMDREGAALIRQGYRLRDQAKPELLGIQGSTGQYLVRWVHVNDSEVNFTRKGYEKLAITKMPKVMR